MKDATKKLRLTLRQNTPFLQQSAKLDTPESNLRIQGNEGNYGIKHC